MFHYSDRTFLAALATIGSSKRLKRQHLTDSYVHRHITKARQSVDNGNNGFATIYQKLIAGLDYDDPTGTYCYHCRKVTTIGDTVITHARTSLSRVYHESCARLINLWP